MGLFFYAKTQVPEITQRFRYKIIHDKINNMRPIRSSYSSPVSI